MAIYSFVALFLLSQLLTLATPVLAQSTTPGVKQLRDLPNAATTVNKLSNQANTSAYRNFFSPDTILTIQNWDINSPPQKASNIPFTFRGKFNFGTGGNSADWFWNRIADEASPDSGGGAIFVLRFCDVGTDGLPIESSCAFGRVPYKYRISEESLPVIGTDTNGLPIINVDSIRTKKIYRYNWVAGDDVLMESFGVTYTPSQNGSEAIGTLDNKTLVPGNRYQADVWACASDENSAGVLGYEGGGFQNIIGNSTELQNLISSSSGGQNIRVFSGYSCNDPSPDSLAYFRLAGFQFNIPTNQQEASTLNSSSTATATASDNNSNINLNRDILPTCAWFGFSGTIVGCFARGVYYLLYQPIAFIAGLFGQLFDFFLGYSISDEAYRMPFAVQAWKLIRDITNIFFILILVYTGFAAVFGSEKVSMKKIVPQLILNAILINFSLVATRTVIDISNVATRVFYNTMRVTNKETNQDIEVAGYKSVSTILVSAFNPQKIFSAAIVSNQSATNSSNTNCGSNGSGCVDNNAGTLDPNAISQGAAASAKNIDLGSAEYAGYFIILCVIAAVIMGGVAAMFWTVAIFFLGRTVGFYVGMIFSPFAFLTRSMPFFDKLETIKWGDWTKELIKNAALGPVFLLFLYVIVLFANSGVKTIISGNSFFETVISVVVPMLILYFLMKQAVDIAKNYAGKFGLSIQKTVEKTIGGGAGAVVGAGLGLAAGGVALLGRAGGGRLMQAIGSGGKKTQMIDGKEVETTRAQRWAMNADNSRFARFMNSTNRQAQEGSWDIRNAGLKIGGKEYTAGNTINKTSGMLGLKLSDNLSGKVGVGVDDGKGGIIAWKKESAKNLAERRSKRISYSHLSDDEAKTVASKRREIVSQQYGETHWEEHIESSDEMRQHKMRVDKAKTDLEQAENELKTIKESGKGDIASARFKVDRLKKEVVDATDNMDTARINLVSNIKNGRDTNAKQQAVAAAGDAEKQRLIDTYGQINNVKDLETMMRSEYARNLQQRSFWNETGVQTAFGAFATAMGGLIPTVGAGLLADAARSISNKITGVDDASLELMIKDGVKLGKRSNTVGQWEANLKKFDDEILKLVNEHASTAYTRYRDAKFEEIEDAILQKQIDLEDQLKALPVDARFERRKLEQQIENLSNLHERRTRVDEKLDNYNRQQENKKKDQGSDTGNKNKGK